MSKNTVSDQVFRAAANARIGILKSKQAYLLDLHNILAEKLHYMETKAKK